ncbi:divergent polysaccharide deacetylase family protein [Rhodobium gokarnense]|uniref:Polysaccharide deacetylase 2 family uncharacterized protein YibQ n=1 Tax=Rhodobium gokarnense TaxID=364296 RepID=A0ABT3HEI1_9HYPH|nr:divergent polysaccharide deacetylase family protein [Rhodobium gokarnense]MCW2308813.1 polysaccharide deacetylase 2 family uncharacterized protein YibQ [Rhodobium gokarnense]
MAADNLTAPLGGKPKADRKKRRFPFGLLAFALFLIVGSTVTAWLSLVDDPHGGEPMATVDIAPTLNKSPSATVDVVDIPKEAPAPGEAGTDDAGDAATLGDGSVITAIKPPGEDIAAVEPEVGPDGALSTQPIPKLMEQGRNGPLPRRSVDGSRPFDLYSAPISPNLKNAPQIAIIVGDLGLSQTGTQEALRKLPKETTLAFAPYGGSLDRWMQKARTGGHELLLQVPLEPFDFPDNDPGPHTLLTSLAPSENLARLRWVLSRLTNYVGVVNYMGARFTADPKALAFFMEDIGRRGLMYLDDGTSPRSLSQSIAHATGTPYAKSEVVIDASPAAADIDTRLLELETIARTNGTGIGVASALPVTVERISEWAKSLESRGVVLVPISAVVRRRQR